MWYFATDLDQLFVLVQFPPHFPFSSEQKLSSASLIKTLGAPLALNIRSPPLNASKETRHTRQRTLPFFKGNSWSEFLAKATSLRWKFCLKYCGRWHWRHPFKLLWHPRQKLVPNHKLSGKGHHFAHKRPSQPESRFKDVFKIIS